MKLLLACFLAFSINHGGGPTLQGSHAPSLLGTWTLKSIHMVIHPPNGRSAYGSDAHLGATVKQITYTRQQWMLKEAGVVWKRGTYRVHGKQVDATDGETFFHERIVALTATRLVIVTIADEVDGTHVDTFATYVR